MPQVDHVKEKMSSSIDVFEDSLTQIRTSGANPGLVSHVMIDYYGMETPINQVASISVIEGKQLLIKPYEMRIVKDIEKAIFGANLGLTPQNEGTQIRINVPALTEEKRREYTNQVLRMAEDAKVAIRNIRREGNDMVKKDKTLPEDYSKSLIEDIQKATDDAIKQIDEIAATKNKEIMTV
ncbi:MAG: ribosome recycling factor [Bacillota bacterium]|jgi:ribosome recycling factor|nr:ribosome recycling factor [Bacillota bacterium]NLL25875.1 ribosome recycling factor [Erysipelotrichia bacterium]